jgi:exosortase/archaeosortase family protein
VATPPDGLIDLPRPAPEQDTGPGAAPGANADTGHAAALALTGGRVALGTTGDDSGRAGVPASARRTAWLRLGLVAACLVAVYGRDLAALPAALTLDSPLSYAALAPVLAVLLGILGIRDTKAAPALVPVAAGDALCGGALLIVAVLIGWSGPDLFGFAATPWRVSLASLPFFVAGAMWLLFGGRAAWWLRQSFFFAGLSAPVWYVWAVTPLLTLTTNLTWFVVSPLANLLGARTVDAGTTGLVAIGDQLAAVSSVCSGTSSMVAWLVVGGALSTRLAGPSRRKWRWLLSGAALALVVNVVRILLVVLVGRYVSASVALGWIHPYAGLVAVVVVCVLMLGGTRRLGLVAVDSQRAPVLNRLAAVAPPRAPVAVGAVVAAAAVLALAAISGAWRLDALGARNGEVNPRVGATLASAATVPVGTRRWPLVDFGEVAWASQYFGSGARWHRYGVFAAAAGEQGSWSVAIDTTEVTDPANLDAYTLEACYGFHGYQLERVEVSDLLPRRPAERIDYLDTATRTQTVVVSWRQRVAGDRIERVVVSAVARTVDTAGAGATLPDVTSAEAAVADVARSLAGGA